MTSSGNTITYVFMNYIIIPAVAIIVLVALTFSLPDWYMKIPWALLIYFISFVASSIVLKLTGKPAFKDGIDKKQRILAIFIKALAFSLSASFLLTYAFTDDRLYVDNVGFSVTWKFLVTYLIVWAIIAALPRIAIRGK